MEKRSMAPCRPLSPLADLPLWANRQRTPPRNCIKSAQTSGLTDSNSLTYRGIDLCRTRKAAVAVGRRRRQAKNIPAPKTRISYGITEIGQTSGKARAAKSTNVSSNVPWNQRDRPTWRKKQAKKHPPRLSWNVAWNQRDRPERGARA